MILEIRLSERGLNDTSDHSRQCPALRRLPTLASDLYHSWWPASLTEGFHQHDTVGIFNGWIRDCADDNSIFFPNLLVYDDNKYVISCEHGKECRVGRLEG